MSIALGPLQFEEPWLYKQFRSDLKDDWFPDPRGFDDMIESGIVKRCVEENFTLNQGRYSAAASTLFNLPKPNFTLRYALEMSIQDRILYQGAAAHLLPAFDPCLDWKIFSHRFDPNGNLQRSMFKPHVASWKNFVGGVKAALGDGSVLVSTDISNFYEHIEIKRLEETFLNLLPEVQVPPSDKSHLRECLERLFEWLFAWAFSSARGLPQNRDASSFLANVYMIPVDRTVIETGNEYFRYMDDIKIVCPDVQSARRVLKTLILALRERGLSVNAKKTDILSAKDPGVSEHLSEVSEEIQALDAEWNTRQRLPILRSLPALKEKTLALVNGGKTDGKDFRFCIKRLTWLAGCKDMSIPVEFFGEITQAILKALYTAPASTDVFVQYLSFVQLRREELASIAEFLLDPAHRIYTWQDYRVWLLLLSQGQRDERLVSASLEIIRGGIDSSSRAGATLYLGRFGTASEKASAAEQFKTLSSFLGQRCAIIAAHELPFSPLIDLHVKPFVRSDLKGVYRALQQSKGTYYRKFEPHPITQFVDEGDDYGR